MIDGIDRLTAALADRYRIERELGAGGMATVYLAEDLRHRRQVALKVLLPELSASLGAERFLREIEVTASLQHPHILALYDSGQMDGSLFYVMPYVAGDTLRARLKRDGQLPIGDAVRIARGVASALAFAHRQGVVHRDIKPENILLVEGEALVADFGIARAVAAAGGTTLTGTGITLGTPTYMSPEQAAADKQIDGRSDVYSLGCVLYEMLAGDPPYGGATAQVITARKLTEPLPSLRTIRSSISEEIEAIVLRALERAPADRFATADEMAVALDRAVSGAHTTSYATRAQRRGAGWRQRAWQAAAILGIATSVALAWRGQRASPATAAQNLVAASTIILPDSAPMAFVGEAPFRIGLRSLALSGDGHMLAYVGWYRGRTHLFVRPLDQDQVRRLEGTEGAYEPFFSPNGRSVAFFANGLLRKVSIDGGTPVTLASAPIAQGGVWLADGRIVFGKWNGQRPTLVSEHGGDTTALASPEAFKPVRVIWSAAAGSERIAASADLHTWMTAIDRSGTAVFDTWLDVGGFERLRAGERMEAQVKPGLNGSPQFLGRDMLIIAGEGRLHAVRYDPRTLAARGSTVPLDEMVRQEAQDWGAQFATDGARALVYAPGRSVEQGYLIVADMRGGVDTLPFPQARYWSASFSPDGTRIAVNVRVSHGWELRVLDLRSRTHVVAAASSRAIYDPVWSADGQHVAFQGDSAGWAYEVRASGGDVRKVPQMRYLHARSPQGGWSAWSDSAWRSYLSAPSGEASSIEGLAPHSFSRDGKWLVGHDVTRGGCAVRSTEPKAPVFVVVSEFCLQAEWLPSGREIAYLGGDNYLRVVPLVFDGAGVRGGTPRRLRTPRVLPRMGKAWSLSPDGQRLLYVADTEGDSTTRLQLIVNYRSKVDRLIAGAEGRNTGVPR